MMFASYFGVAGMASIFPPTSSDTSLKDLIQVQKGVEAFTTRAVSLKDVEAGAFFATITGSQSNGRRTYATVQISKDHDFELATDLVYINHACKPILVFDTKAMEVRVVDNRSLKKGDELTFFYPSTEWDMSQSFDCTCGAGAGVCRGRIRGAKYLSRDVLDRYWLNEHIHELLKDRDLESSGSVVG